jgi:hypothetical protein
MTGIRSNLAEGEVEGQRGEQLVEAVRARLAEGENLLDATFALIGSKDTPSDALVRTSRRSAMRALGCAIIGRSKRCCASFRCSR